MTVETQTVISAERSTPMEGIETWINPRNGFKVIDLHYKADPRKRSPEWLENAKKGMPKADFDREFGDTWIVYDGKPVYQDYNPDIHLIKGSIKAPRRVRLISAFDAGPNDVNLGWALGLASPDYPHIIWIDEFFVDDGDVDGFLEGINSRLRLEWYRLGGFTIHVADQSVFTPSTVAKGRSIADLMRRYGFNAIPGEIAFSKRRAGVEKLLTNHSKDWTNTTQEHWRVQEKCAVITAAMAGGYHYPKSMSGVGGSYKESPAKNSFSHIMNAVEYGCSRLDMVNQEIPYENRPLPDFSLI